MSASSRSRSASVDVAVTSLVVRPPVVVLDNDMTDSLGSG
jgi:hypothetical protein